jgi:hypothetical protein
MFKKYSLSALFCESLILDVIRVLMYGTRPNNAKKNKKAVRNVWADKFVFLSVSLIDTSVTAKFNLILYKVGTLY